MNGCTMRARLAAGLAAVALTTSVRALDGVPEYHVTRMGELISAQIPGTETSVSRSSALNENGDLVGEVWLSTQKQAWVYTVEHGLTPLPMVPGYASNAATDVSDRDASGEIVIVGAAQTSIYSETGIAVLWRFSTVTGAVLELRLIPELPGYTEGVALAVNNDGIVIGYSDDPLVYRQPFKYDVATQVIEPLVFAPSATPVDLNNAGQIVGGRYRGDLDGNFTDLGIPPDCTSAFLAAINDDGMATGRAGRPFTDGAGHFMVSIVRHTGTAWHVLPAFSFMDNGGDINIHGDVCGDIGVSSALRSALYIESVGELHLLEDLLAPAFFNEVFPVYAAGINDHGQVAAYSGDAVLLTPLGVMVIPGDVNGDVQVDLDDHCAWLANPIDLDGDGVVDEADEAWLIARLAVFGFTVSDCNGNGTSDHCDIVEGVSNDCDANGVPDECQADCNGDGVPDVCEPDCNANGNPDPCDIAQGASDDCNGNGIPDECDGGGVIEATRVFDPPLELYESLTLTDDLLVTDVGVVEDLDFTINIHYRIGDLTVLLSHNGTTITLLDRPGHPEVVQGSGQFGYAPGVLDDEGAGGPIEDEGNFGSPFEPITSPPSYTPDDPLSTFDGMPMEGVWTVTVITTPFWSPVDTFDDWSLTITRAAVPVPPCECAGDLDGSGAVGFGDVLAVIAAWGPCGPDCPEDMNGNGSVDFADVLMVIAAWGPC
ncbi:MAG: hypothetical protein ACYTGP_01910 [Planctomycetota bacterium]|jgi:hypothetical protein